MRPQLQPISIDQIVRREVQQDPPLEKNPPLEKAIRLYEKEKENIEKMDNWWERQEYAFNLEIPILNPIQLQLFCAHEEANEAFPLYLNSIIQKIYKKGNNNFTITLKQPHYDLLSQVQGTKEQPLNITINGNAGTYCAYRSKHLNITINGNTGHNCALASEDTTITINGNTGDWCADWSTNAKITINGKIGLLLSINATYFTNNKATYEQLKAEDYNVTLL